MTGRKTRKVHIRLKNMKWNQLTANSVKVKEFSAFPILREIDFSWKQPWKRSSNFNFTNFYVKSKWKVSTVQICKFANFSPTICLQKIRQINFFTKQVYCKSIWRKIFAVGENFHILVLRIFPWKQLWRKWENSISRIFMWNQIIEMLHN